MWLFTPTGFLSVVADREHPGNLLVRARARADIEAFVAVTAAPPPTERPDRDYRWRTSVPAAVVATYVAEQTAAIDYGNFKSAVAERQGRDRAHRYAEVWSVMHRLQEDEVAAARRARG
ncbi:hypothetical protein NBH00_03065 [Paraconexibacter antarcticus]|uniref:Uncharacterized protein n=1 Tax=Paraconexibacter antarcticus TaxID=2949664 RepID=A0ABY5DVU4_9ACTN|nr:hypothetical protein [Paraconexibacter antarcticus]UTI65197.1 hypothetical protein NBH00_03065 [Paraconexibacter antarcticus]